MQSITLIIKVGFDVICVAVVLNNLCHALHYFISINMFCVTNSKPCIASLSQLNFFCCIY